METDGETEPSPVEAKRMEKWLKRDDDKRFQMLWDSIYQTAALPYQSPSYQLVPRFAKGDRVVVFKKFFWDAEILSVSKEASYCADAEKFIPAYSFKYIGWSKKFDEHNIPEWDLWPTDGPHMYAFQPLYAHYWNQYHLLKQGRAGQNGIYLPSPEVVDYYEQIWKKESDGYLNMSFAEFVGMPETSKKRTAGSAAGKKIPEEQEQRL